MTVETAEKTKQSPGPAAQKRKRRLGDRYDGRRIRSMDPMNIVIPYVMKTRSGASNMLYRRADIRNAERYIRRKRVEGLKGFGMLHFFMALYVRVASQWPGVNRFIAGQRLFARHDIEIIVTVKKELSVEGQETTIKVACLPSDTADDIYRRVSEALEEARLEGDSNNMDNMARALTRIPGLLFKIFVWLITKLDYFGRMPKAINRASPFHGSLFIADLGSIGLPPVHHHLYDFGNIPLFLVFGRKEKEVVPGKDGSVSESRFLDYSVTLDERICDGYYFSRVVRMMDDIFKDPDQLDTPPEKVVEDID